MTISISPVLLGFGPLAIRWFGLLAVVGLGVAVLLGACELRQQHLGRALALDALAWALPAGIVGARVVHVLGYWDFYLTNSTELWRLDIDGLSLWGGLSVGGLIFAARLGRGGGVRRRRILDAVAPYVLLGIAIGRLGEFLDGHGQGLPSALPWASQYTSPLAATPDFGVPRHPAQLYDALIALLLFGALALAPLRKLPAGTRAAIAVVTYSSARLALGPMRLDPAFVFGFQIEQLLALCGILIGAAFGVRPLLRRGALDHRPSETSALNSATVQPRTNKDSVAA